MKSKKTFMRTAGVPRAASKGVLLSVLVVMGFGGASLALGANRYVNPASASPTPPYASWITAAHTIPDALGVCTPGDVAVVSNGVYALTSEITVPAGVTLTSLSGPANTVINGNGVTRCVFMPGTDSILAGFTITGGSAEMGAGVYCVGSTVTNCVITDNHAVGDAPAGGGVYCDGGAVSDCVIRGNSATSTNTYHYGAFAVGGGICAVGQSQIDHTTVANNGLTGYYANGGGINANGGSVENCAVNGNTAYGHWYADGGGVYMTANTDGLVRTCLITGNNAHTDRGQYTTNEASGGGVYFNSGPPALENCTISGNSIDGDFSNGGGLYCGASDQIRNTIIIGNTATAGQTANAANYFPNQYAPPTFDHCCAAPLPPGVGNIAAGPGFASGGFRLNTGSPCIDRGTNQAWMTTATDLDGNVRIASGTVDMGAYEWSVIITTEPASVTVSVGANAAFSVTAGGIALLNFQWQVLLADGSDWSDLTNGSNYSGATTATLAITGATTAMNGCQYRCVISSPAGGATSVAATLGVIFSDPAFLQRLFSDVLGREIDPGALASFGAALAGGESRAAALGDLYGSVEYTNRQVEPAIRLYYAALARSPDYVGLQNWSNALHGGTLTLTGAADQFASSAEFVLKYGSLNNTGYVQQLYRNVLGREADPSGLADWVGQLNAGASRGTILVGFSESDEFKGNLAAQVEILRLYFLLDKRMPTPAELQGGIGFLKGYDQTETLLTQGYPAGLSNSDYVQLVFRGFLRRDADAGTLSTFGSALAAGTVTHGSLVETAIGSTEFNLFVAPVSRLYLAALRRVPDPAGLNNWVNYVRAGNSLQVMADAFAASQEFINRYGAMTNQNYVAQLYRDVLGREADPAGLASWTALLDAGSTTRGQILIGFSESQEAVHLFAPTLRTFLHYFTFLNATPTQQDLDFWKNNLATLTNQIRADLLADPTFANGG